VGERVGAAVGAAVVSGVVQVKVPTGVVHPLGDVASTCAVYVTPGCKFVLTNELVEWLWSQSTGNTHSVVRSTMSAQSHASYISTLYIRSHAFAPGPYVPAGASQDTTPEDSVVYS